MTDFEQAFLEKLERQTTAIEDIAIVLKVYALQPTDAECLEKLVDTGFIMTNPRVKGRTAYLVQKAHNVLDVFDELAKITGSGLRARAIMFQNMVGVETTLNKHRPKKNLKT